MSDLASILKNPLSLTPDVAGKITADIMANQLTPSQIGGFLVAIKLLGKETDPATIAAVAKAMQSKALPVELPFDVVDIVGTGGDGQNTFNVSTAASIIVAGAGVKVAKHGSRASSSTSGSADVLEALGCHLESVSPTAVGSILDSSNFCFLFAQSFHPAMRHVAASRKELGVRTIFNMLGPLTNPARPSKMVVGVFSKDIGRIMAEALHLSGVREGWVVHGLVGLDEISPEGSTLVWAFDSMGTITERTISPADFGLAEHPLRDVVGGEANENAATMSALLDNALTGPIVDFVLMNAAALLYVAGAASNLKEGVALARQSISSGTAKQQLHQFATKTHFYKK
ncbi:anthranilate phosphoribosyltransferase [Batrachochytrium dendrobatidis]|nr:anthranilate phosphoribosyltransferase [Batrachochytrium dendrobatidis]KAK5670954.1 anthranilate phosphoribosyltransferase [Batrachochytrium dendrobatidis]